MDRRVRDSLLTGAVHLVEIYFATLTKSTHKIFEIPTRMLGACAHSPQIEKTHMGAFLFLRRVRDSKLTVSVQVVTIFHASKS